MTNETKPNGRPRTLTIPDDLAVKINLLKSVRRATFNEIVIEAAETYVKAHADEIIRAAQSAA